MTQFPQSRSDSFNWDSLNVGESHFEGYSLDYKEESLSQIISQSFKTALKEGRIPFLPS